MHNPYDGPSKKRWATHLKVVRLVNHNLPGPIKSTETGFDLQREDYMAEDQVDETLKTIVSWARYAEMFAYFACDEQSEQFSLENPH
jgi:hypothetical protein